MDHEFADRSPSTWLCRAQEGKKIPWIGYLAGSGSAPNQAFVQGMRDLGYVEGKNIAFVYRTTEGRRERYPDIVAELVRLKVGVIVTDVTSAAVALKNATSLRVIEKAMANALKFVDHPKAK